MGLNESKIGMLQKLQLLADNWEIYFKDPQHSRVSVHLSFLSILFSSIIMDHFNGVSAPQLSSLQLVSSSFGKVHKYIIEGLELHDTHPSFRVGTS